MDKIREMCHKFIADLEEFVSTEVKSADSFDFSAFERCLNSKLNNLQDDVSSKVLENLMDQPSFVSAIKSYGSNLGLSRLEKRPVQVQFRTGNKRTIKSWYAKREVGGGDLERHIGLSYLGFIKKASPLYVSTSSLFSVLCPSYDVAKQLMGELGIVGKYNRIRDLSLSLGRISNDLGAAFLLDNEEDMSDKRVVVMMDGGRSRTRSTTGLFSSKRYSKFDTDWKEVKVLVLQVIDKSGKVNRKESLPLYDITVGGIERAMAKLSDLLILLNVKAAKEVQFIADGASGFWNRIEQVFQNAAIDKDKITYTLDYFHAVEHLSELLKAVPLTEEVYKTYWTTLKTQLWKGQISELIQSVKKICNQKKVQIKGKIQTEINYFKKHTKRMQYELFKQQNWLCGSGAVESAIRRIINLRFKSPSSFWKEEHLEPLCFLRAAFLAGRWSILMNNLK